jgi:hypothetical protein
VSEIIPPTPILDNASATAGILRADNRCVGWPPPCPVRRVLVRARRRYHCTLPEERPSLCDPRSYVGLFLVAELTALARYDCWPLPRQALAWVAESPEDRTRRRRHKARRVEDVVRRLLVAELPDAINYLVGRKS